MLMLFGIGNCWSDIASGRARAPGSGEGTLTPCQIAGPLNGGERHAC
jgi:hypothetical protein